MQNDKVSCALTMLHTGTPLIVSETPILQMVKLNRKYIMTYPKLGIQACPGALVLRPHHSVG